MTYSLFVETRPVAFTNYKIRYRCYHYRHRHYDNYAIRETLTPLGHKKFTLIKMRCKRNTREILVQTLIPPTTRKTLKDLLFRPFGYE